MSQAPSMPVFTDALIGDTTHLTTAEFGAYCLILFVTWRNNGQALPDDDKRLARVCRMTMAQWRHARPTLSEFFNLADGTWRQKRLEKEWEFVSKFSSQQSQKGKLSAEARARKNNKTASTTVGTESQPDANPQTQTQTQEVEGGGGGGAHDTDRHAHAQSIAERFEQLRQELWPNESGFPAPRNTLRSQILAYLDLGGTVPLSEIAAVVTETMERGMRHAQETGKRPTVSLLAFKNSIPDAIANHRAGNQIQEGHAHDKQPRRQNGKPTWEEQVRAGREGIIAALSGEIELDAGGPGPSEFDAGFVGGSR